jgi:hypothetical protein
MEHLTINNVFVLDKFGICEGTIFTLRYKYFLKTVGGGADDDDDDDDDDEDNDKGDKPVQSVIEQVPPPHCVGIEEHNDADDADEQFEVVVSMYI